MKKKFLIIALSLTAIGTACDTLQQENISPESGELILKEVESDSNARKGFDLILNKKLVQINELTDLAYAEIGNEEAIHKAILHVRKQGGGEQFLEEMISWSLKKYDNIVLKRGGFLSQEARRKHATMAGGEHEFEYDLQAGYEEAAADFYLKIEGVKGESSEEKYELVKTILGPGKSGNCIYPLCGGWSVNKGHVIQLADFIKVLIPRYSPDPSALGESLQELTIDAGMDPVAIALLLPAVQKAAEVPNARKLEDQNKKLLEALGLPDSEEYGDFLQAGGEGALNKFLFGSYDLGEDLDWAAIQLNRAKFEMEMFYLWEAFWNENQTDPTTGR